MLLYPKTLLFPPRRIAGAISKVFTNRENIFLAKAQRRKEITFYNIFLIREIRQNS
jgi:hypothetical protein